MSDLQARKSDADAAQKAATVAAEELVRKNPGHKQPCSICGEPCDAWTGNATLWPLYFPDADQFGTGEGRYHHSGCVADRIASQAREIEAAGIEPAKWLEETRIARAEVERLTGEVGRRKGDPITRLHNLIEGAEEVSGAFDADEFHRLDDQATRLQRQLATVSAERDTARAALVDIRSECQQITSGIPEHFDSRAVSDYEVLAALIETKCDAALPPTPGDVT